MPGDWDRNVHPDLVDDAESASPSEPSAPRPRGRGRANSDAALPATAGEAVSEEPVTESGSEGTAEPDPATPDLAWFDQVRDAKDPVEALRLITKNLPRDQLEKDEVMSGVIGARAERRFNEIKAQQERAAQERAKLEAAANNDLYTLGEMTQRELQGQLASQQAAQAASPFMDGIVQFQKTLPEAIQKKIAGKTFGAGKGYAEGVAEYVAAIVDEAVELGVSKRESALRKSVMSEINGDEPVPERDSGTPGRVREVTDEMIAAMTLREYEALFDENGKPKPGVRHRSTRGIPVRQH
jgi:hypothetical protein